MNVVLSLSLALPSTSFGGEHLDNARSATEKNKVIAGELGQSLAMADMTRSLQRALMILNQKQIAQVNGTSYTEMHSDLQDIEDQLTKLSRISLSGNESKLEKRVNKAIATYKKLANQRLKKTYDAVELRFDLVKLKALVKDVSKDYAQTCETGKTVADLNFFAGQIPNMPNPIMDTEISIGNQGYKVKYNASYGVDPDKEKEYAAINQGLQAATGLTYSLSMASTVGASAFNVAVIEGAAAAGPWVLGAAVAFAIYSDLMFSAELYKIQNDIFKANSHLFEKNANNEDVIAAYKNTCQSFSNNLNTLAEKVDRISENPEANKQLSTEVKSSLDERIKWQEKKEVLNQAILVEKVVSKVKDECETKLEVVEKMEAGQCYIPSLPWLDLEVGHHEISDSDIKSIKKSIDEIKKDYEESYDFSDITRLSSDSILEVLLALNKMNFDHLKDINWDKLERVQQQTLNRVINLISTLRRQRNINNEEIILIEKELELTDQYEKLLQQYQDVVALAIKQVFGKVSKEELLLASNKMDQEWSMFYELYASSKEVRNFNSNWKSLVNYIKAL